MNAPIILDVLEQEERAHFAKVQDYLAVCGVPFTINPRLVRGLDYYNDTVFEWTTESLGAQGTVCGGGRYDALVAQLGGKPTPAAGCALGLERLLSLWQMTEPRLTRTLRVAVLLEGAELSAAGMQLAQQLRSALNGATVCMFSPEFGLKSQFKRADKSGFDVVVILKAASWQQGHCLLKHLRQPGGEQALDFAALLNYLKEAMHAG